MHCFVHLTISHSVLFVLVLNKANQLAKDNVDKLKQRSGMGPPAEKVTITKKALEELKKRAAEGEKHKKEADRLKKELQVSQNKVGELEKNLEDATKKYDECRKECDDLKEEYDDIMADDVRAKDLTISALEKASGGSKVSTKPKVLKEDLNQELVNHVTQVAKTIMFRTWKFIEDELEEKEVTEDIIQYFLV